MDRIRTLLLARTHTVVLDPDRVAEAATRPTRDADVDKFEDELAQLGYVMSLDLALTMRRLPHEAIQELRNWIFDTLAKQLGAHRPHVPLFRGFPAATPANTPALYLRRVLTWLLTVPDQPCPWCGEIKAVGALDPCGHLVCRTCWDGGNFSGCPICHRRIALGDPFVKPGPVGEKVTRHAGTLTLLHLAFDLIGTAQLRFTRLLSRTTPLSPDDRAEVETVIDTIGPKAMMWLPPRIPVKETAAIVLARMWVTAPDRSAMVRATGGHLRTATDVLRVASVLMGGNAELVEPIKLRSVSRGLRRAILEALDRLPPALVAEDVARHLGLWKRVGERLHPYEFVDRLPNAALAFALIRGTKLAATTFAPLVRERAASVPSLRIARDQLRIARWAAPVEDALRAGDPTAALAHLAQRPGDLLRRVDHLVRMTEAKQPEALGTVLAGIRAAATRGAPPTLLTLASHVARRGTTWPRRVFFPKGEVLRAWGAPDTRPPLRADTIGSLVSAIRAELIARAETQRHYPRAVIDRGLVELLVPINERNAAPAKIAWPRGSEIPIPEGQTLRLFLHWEEPANARVDLDLSVVMFDEHWRHTATCDFRNLVVGDRVAVHSGDLTSAPAPLGASEFVDLHIEPLYLSGARHVVMVVFSYNAVPFDRLTYGFAGLMLAPAAGQHFDARAVAQRFDLRGRSMITVPLTIDLAERRLRWIDVHVPAAGAMHEAGGYRAALAHIARDFGDFVGSHARPTMWDVACIHAAARANIAYVRERDGTITTYRRRDGESTVARLGRMLSGGAADDAPLAAIPPADAPTWFALVTGDLALPKGSVGYILDARTTGGDGIERLAANDLVAELTRKM
jgi:hypothetical protein